MSDSSSRFVPELSAFPESERLLHLCAVATAACMGASGIGLFALAALLRWYKRARHAKFVQPTHFFNGHSWSLWRLRSNEPCTLHAVHESWMASTDGPITLLSDLHDQLGQIAACGRVPCCGRRARDARLESSHTPSHDTTELPLRRCEQS